MTITIYGGDCREVIAGLPDASVDLVLTDPPYCETDLEWDQRCEGWMQLLPRVMKPSASLWMFGSMRFFLDQAVRGKLKGWKLAQEIIWEKHNGSNSRADRFRRVHELAVHFYPARSRWSEIYNAPVYSHDAIARTIHRKQRVQHWSKLGEQRYTSVDGGKRLMRSVMYVRSEHGRAIHPTQKPTQLLGPIIELSAPPGGVILDCFAGSGSTGITASALGRDAILIEKDPVQLAKMRRRLEQDAPLLSGVAA